PDGILLELVARAGDERRPWEAGPVPAERAVRGVAGVTLTEWNPDVTAEVLTGLLGFRKTAELGDRIRFDAGGNTRVDVVGSPSAPRGQVAAGTVHHVAWRTPDDANQKAWHEELLRRGFHVSPILDRQYFHSIYFREPGGVLFEIATDPPGFTKDEPVETLGTELKLPPWLESEREAIEGILPGIELRNEATA
ncbi:MAG: VOC family protein, partial [Thermoanaerobaculia bacterium]